jgi:hypothetical protein
MSKYTQYRELLKFVKQNFDTSVESIYKLAVDMKKIDKKKIMIILN